MWNVKPFFWNCVPSSLLSTVATFPPLEDHPAGMTLSITVSQHLSPRVGASCSLQFVSVAQSESISKPRHVTCCSSERHAAVVSKDVGSARRALLTRNPAQWGETRTQTGSWAEKDPGGFHPGKFKGEILPRVISLLFILVSFPFSVHYQPHSSRVHYGFNKD